MAKPFAARVIEALGGPKWHETKPVKYRHYYEVSYGKKIYQVHADNEETAKECASTSYGINADLCEFKQVY